ncbi:MAG: tRNA (cytidine(34)-2'-O)-methyltransferase [Bdellovibrionota bacterium]|nr:tRNA (cytidine(34)-2'-O)-methyltransferase [Bdellovibrionota bacterium]
MDLSKALEAREVLNITLVEPEIPNNTGNIGRTCVGLRSALHLVGPYAFDLSEKKVRRAGLDYWPHLNLHQYESTEDWLKSLKDRSRVFLFTTKAEKSFYDIDYKPGDTLVFGKETAGLSAELRGMFAENCVKLPMPGEVRSFNLANTVAVAAFEAYRQIEKANS